MPTLKQRLGGWLMPRMPVNPWVFRTFRVELNALFVRALDVIHPGWVAKARALRRRRELLVNGRLRPVRPGGLGQSRPVPGAGASPCASIAGAACRWPMGRRAVSMSSTTSSTSTPRSSGRASSPSAGAVLEPGRVLRIIVPDMHKYIEAYLSARLGPAQPRRLRRRAASGDFRHQDRGAEPRLCAGRANTMAASTRNTCATRSCRRASTT